MQDEIQNYITYLKEVKHAAANTVIAYEGDLQKLKGYLENFGIYSSDKVTEEILKSYILELENTGMSDSTVSRSAAVIRRFFDFQHSQGVCGRNPAQSLQAPRVVKKTEQAITDEQLQAIIPQKAVTPKQMRDRAMLLTLTAGVRASEIITALLTDLNLEKGYLTLRKERQTRNIILSEELCLALSDYIEQGRIELIHGLPVEYLFVNCNGTSLSRQGVWKTVKYYGDLAGIHDLTPDCLRRRAYTSSAIS